MVDEVLYELGVDFNSDFNFSGGDLVLSSYDDNLVQAIVNKLNTELDELDLFYESYGSVLKSFMGWKANDETLNFIKAEIETVLKSEDRLVGWNCNVEYEGNGKVKVDLILNPNPDYTIETTLSISNYGVEVIE